MDVKLGYKQTEVGTLPDWGTGPIGRAIETLEAGTSVNSEKDEAPEFDSYPCVLKTGAARKGSFDPWESKKVAKRDLWQLKVSLRKNTILVSRMNTAELVGDSGYVDVDYPNLFVPDRMWMTTVRSTGHVDPRWLSYILTWQPVKSQISASATGTSGSMKNISKMSFRAVEIPYPPVEEQRAIAEVLSDADALAKSLEQLLSKKRQLKQGAMRELLTGRKRLPGFETASGTKPTDVGPIPADWDVKAVKEMGHVEAGKALNASGPGTQRPYLRTKNVLDGRLDLEDVLSMPMTDSDFLHFRLNYGDILLNEGQSLELVGRCSLYRNEYVGPCAIQNQLVRFRGHLGVSAEFAEQMFRFCQRTGVFRGIATQTTSVAHLGVSRFQQLRLAWPSDSAEQRAIASVLADMDSELYESEARLAKARLMKRGMLEELLSGRIRFV